MRPPHRNEHAGVEWLWDRGARPSEGLDWGSACRGKLAGGARREYGLSLWQFYGFAFLQ